MTDDQARDVQQYEYDSFGNLHDMKNRIKQPYGYTGREYDRETGLYYYRARYYDGEVGRFISEDPIGFAGGDVNLYGYVKNEPVRWVDPFGLIRYPAEGALDTVGRPGTMVPPGGKIGSTLQDHVGSAWQFGEYHDNTVEKLTDLGLPDFLVNIPTMLPVYLYANIKDQCEMPIGERSDKFLLLEARW